MSTKALRNLCEIQTIVVVQADFYDNGLMSKHVDILAKWTLVQTFQIYKRTKQKATQIELKKTNLFQLVYYDAIP